MTQAVTGELDGLKPSQRKALERTFGRLTQAQQIVGLELARHLAWISADIGRQVGVLIDRQGHVVECFVGDHERIYLPDIGRQRAGTTRLRGLRHIHTVFSGGLSNDDRADLQKLRLDLVATLLVNSDASPGAVQYAYHTQAKGIESKFAVGVAQLNLDIESGKHPSLTDLVRDVEADKDVERLREGTTLARAILVGVYPSKNLAGPRLEELRELCATAGVHVADVVTQIRPQVDPKYVVGKGKLEDVVLRALAVDAELIIIDHPMSPAQARAIAASSDLKVIDRTQLILDIFAQHAHSRDGKLQVELAQLRYNLPRLTDMDAGMSRLTGGIGGRGPGETKLEINRRRARDRISRLEKEIDHLSDQRQLRRKQRSHGGLPIVSIVGYTNAGKSTLLNRLTRSDVMVANKLFATLDPTSRRLRFPYEREAIITDTVGFIRDLPPDLVKAFRATLEELAGSDLLLHVVDISDPQRQEKIDAVKGILKDLELAHVPALLVYNKSDKVDALEQRSLSRRDGAVCVSAQTGDGLDKLVSAVLERLWPEYAVAQPDWQTRDDGDVIAPS